MKAGREPDLLSPLQRHHRHQPARPRPAAQRLLRRCAPAPVVLQEARHRQNHRPGGRPAGRNRGPFRQAARAGADAHRRAPPAGAERALRRGQGRRGARRDQHHLQGQPAHRADEDHRADPEKPPHQTGGQ